MSTRVHELAKELGLKSQDLIDRIQKEGLDVKPSPLASLDLSMVDRIKDLIQGRSAPAREAAQATSPSKPAEPSRPTSSPPPSETPAIVPTAQAPRKPAPTGPASGSGEPAAPSRPEAPTTPSTAPPSVPLTSRPSGPAAQANAPARPPQAQPSSGQGSRQGGGGSGGPGGGSAPLSAHTRGGASTGRAGGPLSGHTPHRTGSGGPPPRPGQDQGQGGSGPRPNPTSPPPLRRDDYISPTGTSRPSQPAPTRPGSGGNQPPLRRSEGDSGSRREGGPGPRSGGRPLPSVAASAPAAPRRPEAPRPPVSEGKAQRPDMKFTPAQLLEMARSGQLNAGGPGLMTGKPAPAPAAEGPARTCAGLPLRPTPPPARLRPRRPGPRRTTIARARANQSRLGTAADRAGRRDKRAQRAAERRSISSPVPASALMEGEDDTRRNRGPRRQKGGRRQAGRGAEVATPRSSRRSPSGPSPRPSASRPTTFCAS